MRSMKNYKIAIQIEKQKSSGLCFIYSFLENEMKRP